MRAKLGLSEDVDGAVLAPLVQDLLDLLTRHRPDHTTFFRALAAAARGDRAPVQEVVGDAAAVDGWLVRWLALDPDAAAMDRVNPVYVPRNHLVEEALTAATGGDLGPLERLLEAVDAPFDERPGFERYAAPAPEDFGPYQTFCGT